jgi:hypothetical protein
VFFDLNKKINAFEYFFILIFLFLARSTKRNAQCLLFVAINTMLLQVAVAIMFLVRVRIKTRNLLWSIRNSRRTSIIHTSYKLYIKIIFKLKFYQKSNFRKASTLSALNSTLSTINGQRCDNLKLIFFLNMNF